MMKKVLAVAIASAFAAPAFAATANVDISGKIAYEVSKISNTGNNDATTKLSSNNSRFTFRASEDLGGGMKAGVSATLGFGAANGAATSAQDTFVFIGGNWGEVRAGVHDNLVKFIGRRVDLFADQITGDARHLTQNQANLQYAGATATARTGNVIDARANNVVAYLSPTFSGFQVAAGVALDEDKRDDRGQITMATGTYTNGPLYVGLGYYKADNALAAGNLVNVNGVPVPAIDQAYTGADEKAWRLGARYNMGDLSFVGLYQNVKNIAGFDGFDAKTWGLGAGYKMGAMTFKGQYYKLDGDGSDFDSNMYALGMDYAFSKRTVAQVAYSKVANKDLAALGGMNAVGAADTFNVVAGKDPSRLSLGLVHNF